MLISSCSSEVEAPADGFPKPDACKNVARKKIKLEMDRSFSIVWYDDWVDTSQAVGDDRSKMFRALDLVCTDVEIIWTDGYDPIVMDNPLNRFHCAEIAADCHSHPSNTHLILVNNYLVDSTLLGLSGYRAQESDSAWSFVFTGHVAADMYCNGWSMCRRDLGTFTATHELGHQSGIIPHACMKDWITNEYTIWDTTSHSTPDCVMAVVDVHHSDGLRTLKSKCSSTGNDLFERVEFCEKCWDKLSKCDW